MDVSSGTPGPAAWRVLLGYARPYTMALAGGALLSLATAATGLVLPLVVRALIDELSGGRSLAGWLLLLTGLMVANAAIGAIGGYVLERSAESVVLTARRGLVSRMLRLRMSAMDSAEPGDLMSRVTADTTLLREVTADTLVGGFTGVLTVTATVVMMALLDPVLLGVTLLAVLLVGSVVGVVVPRINRAASRAQESVGAMGAALERAFGAFRTVKAAGAEERETIRIRAATTAAWRASVRAAKWQALAGNLAWLAAYAAFVAVLGAGGARVAAGATGVGTLVAFLLYVYYLTPAVEQLIRAATRYQVGAAAVARIQQVEALPAEPAGAIARLPHARAGPAAVAFERVWFRYGAGRPPVHRGVTFSVPPGGVTAFVGPSGAGKTTVFSLIERFWEAESGRVLVDGIDVRDWPVTGLRAGIGYVEQEAPVLAGTLRENLRFGAPDATECELRAALAAARLDAMVDGLPEGLDTEVGHRGYRLSGGERQRVAIARALLRRPRLLLLDEATSQLDAVNEAALRDALAGAARTATVLVVAHRLSTVTTADRIVVMDAGQVRAIGSHTELVAGERLYAELAATQLLGASSAR